MAGQGALSVHGRVESGQYLWYEGGNSAGVFDENWNRLRDLPVTKSDYSMPTGLHTVSIKASSTKRPWLEVQFMTEGEPMIVRQSR